MTPHHSEPAFCLSTVFLVGMRACGKTTLGRMLAEHLGYAFADTDELVRQRSGGRQLADIVAVEGWKGFRRREALVLAAAAAPFTVVATGGGVVLSPANRRFLRRSGVCVYLSAPVDLLCGRLRRDPALAQRPPLSGIKEGSAPVIHPADEVEAVLREREPLYREVAQHVVPAGLSVAELIECVSSLAAFPARSEERNL